MLVIIFGCPFIKVDKTGIKNVQKTKKCIFVNFPILPNNNNATIDRLKSSWAYEKNFAAAPLST